jgi:hypothetical protein
MTKKETTENTLPTNKLCVQTSIIIIIIIIGTQV